MTKSDAAMLDAVIKAVKDAGDAEEDCGALEIGAAEPDRPGAALHILLPPASKTLIEEGERDLERPIPAAYQAFLRKANGLHAFAESFSLFGVIPDTDEIAHPFDLTIPNVDERPEGATDSMFFFAFYDWDGSLLYAEDDDAGRVHRTGRDKVDPQQSWDSIPRAIHDEFFRLAELFDDGFDESKKTVPD